MFFLVLVKEGPVNLPIALDIRKIINSDAVDGLGRAFAAIADGHTILSWLIKRY